MFLKGFENYMIPCVNKKFFGIDCLGCGMQRATLHIFSGEFALAFTMYPAIYTIILFAGFMLFNLFVKIKYSETIKAGLMIANISIILLNYFFKHIL